MVVHRRVSPDEHRVEYQDCYVTGESQLFRRYYGPTMNAFDAAEKNGTASDLQKELEILFESQNKSPHKEATSIPATFLRVTVFV